MEQDAKANADAGKKYRDAFAKEKNVKNHRSPVCCIRSIKKVQALNQKTVIPLSLTTKVL
jgi:hypothetical protein